MATGYVLLSRAPAVTVPARRDERGVTLIIFTLMITVMLVFVALAMDSGLVFNERRQDQSAIDAAVLAAAQLLLDDSRKPSPDLAAAKLAAEDTIIKDTHENTQSTNDIPLDQPARWEARWSTCTATAPLDFVPSSRSACIAFHDSVGPGDTSKVWAHLPPITVNSTFGGVVGIDKYTATADATAEIFVGDPYAVFAGATNCDFVDPVEQVVDIGSHDPPRPTEPITINGPMHSNGMVQVLWQNATVPDFVTYVTPPAPPPQIQSRPTDRQDDPLADIAIADYAPGGTKAQAAGNLYRNANGARVNDAWLDDPTNDAVNPATGDLKNVLIYTTGPIDLTQGRGGTATFVSTQTIEFEANNFNVSARTGDVLAFSTAGGQQCGGPAGAAIRFEGGDNTWNGVVYAPNGTIRSGTNQESDPPGLKTFNGGLIGWIVDLDGSNFTITNHSGLGAPAKVRLFR